MPDKYDELLVTLNVNNTESYTYYIPKIYLSDDYKRFPNGYAINVGGTSYFKQIVVKVSKTQASIEFARYYNTIDGLKDQISNTTMEIYYK